MTKPNPPKRDGTGAEPDGCGRNVVVVRGSRQPARLIRRQVRVWHRVVASALGCWLDTRLAAGHPPVDSMLGAVRASRLVTLDARLRLAECWELLLVQAHREPPINSMRAPIRRARIAAAERGIRELMNELSSRAPVPVRGVAMAGCLLTDGTGPLYNRSHPTSVRQAVREVVAVLRSDAPRPGLRLAK